MMGFDLDGVLAVAPPGSGVPWRYMDGPARGRHRDMLLEHYATAPVLYRPAGDFVVVTARRSNDEVRQITTRWLDRNFPGQVCGLRMLSEARSLDNVAKFKASRILAEDFSTYADDMPVLLRRMARLGVPAAKLRWFLPPAQFVSHPWTPRHASQQAKEGNNG